MRLFQGLLLKLLKNQFELSDRIMDVLQITSEFAIPLNEIEITYARSSGPGGQNVNKVSSKAILRWNLFQNPGITEEVRIRFMRFFPSYLTKEGDVVLMCQQHRDAPKNRLTCLEKLSFMLCKAFYKPKKRIPTKRTKSSIRRRLENKAHNARKKERRKNFDE